MRSSRAFPFANGRKIRWIRPCSEILWALGLRGCDAGHGRFIPSEALGWHFVPNPALGTKTDPVLVMLGVPRLCSSAGAEWHGRLHTQHDGFDAIICTSSKYGRKARSRGSTFFFLAPCPVNSQGPKFAEAIRIPATLSKEGIDTRAGPANSNRRSGTSPSQN